jgi:putative phage-type endonuclease
MLLSELEELEDIRDELIFDDIPSIFEDEELAIELVETAMHLMDEYIILDPDIISDPEFHYILLEEIEEILCIQMEEKITTLSHIYNNYEDDEEDMKELLKYAIKIYVATFYPEKFLNINFLEEDKYEYDFNNYEEDDNSMVIIENDPINMNDLTNIIEQKIQKLREIPQPVQRTPEWYKFRWNLITASNAWKALGTQAAINQIIYEKCQPLTEDGVEDGGEKEVKMVNTNSPLHWGQKYEPLTVMVYEDNYGTKVEDFGCIQHDKHKFLGASPDGIIVNKESDRYGRMLEIKNVVSREITGIPKKEYWIQMQLQMEVCDLDDCDFLETKFIEYSDYESFEADSLNKENMCLSKDQKFKGEIIHFHTKEGTPYYAYKPLKCTKQQDIDEWENNTLDIYESEPYNYIYMKKLYWKLEVLSCILVLRDQNWFKNNICQLEDVWKIVEKERITGYEHRAPKKRKMEYYVKPFVEKESQGCLLKFNKIIKVDTDHL